MSDQNPVACLRCQGQTECLGQLPLMTGGSSGVAKLFLGQWAELNEGHWEVDVYRCTRCGHVEMFDLSGLPDK
jgi:hypothetical protein